MQRSRTGSGLGGHSIVEDCGVGLVISTVMCYYQQEEWGYPLGFPTTLMNLRMRRWSG